MKLNIDRKVYSDSCISKSVYYLADKYTILRSIKGNTEILDITPLIKDTITEDQIITEITNTLNDFKLRDIIYEETKDVKTIIYAKAFSDYNDPNE